MKGLLPEEDYFCLHCWNDFPFFAERNNGELRSRFFEHIPEDCYAFLNFSKGNKCRDILHQIKYDNQTGMAELLGERFGKQLKETGFGEDIDCIVPIPLHRRKLRRRGYNQSAHLAIGMSKALEIPWSSKYLKRSKFTATQTKKDKLDRRRNVSDVFKSADLLEDDTHILIIDDVMTSGATLESAAKAITISSNVKISFACLAVAEKF